MCTHRRRSLLVAFLFRAGFICVASGFLCNPLGRKTPPRAVQSLLSESLTPQFGLYEVQEEMLVKRGKLEEDLMKDNIQELKVGKSKRSGGGRGFGGGGSASKRKNFEMEAKVHASELKRNGVVRIDNVLDQKIIEPLRTYAYQRRAASAQIGGDNRFADVLLRENRCDLLLPLGEPIVAKAVHHVLEDSVVAATIERCIGDNAVLHELSCLISDSGSNRQVIHPDTPQKGDGKAPTLLTCFIALQDISLDMGPTTFLPGTHKPAAHKSFFDDSQKDEFLASARASMATLSAGSAALFDSRVLHAGTANRSSQPRSIFYFSFRSSRHLHTGNPPSIRSDLADRQVPLNGLMEKLTGIHELGERNDFVRDVDENSD